MAAKMFIGIIRFWQKTLSPDHGKFRFLYFSPIFSLSPESKPGCRFYPTCSEYAVGVLKDYSLGRALTLSVKRVFRCHSGTTHNND